MADWPASLLFLLASTHVHGAGAVGGGGEGELEVVDVADLRGGVGGRHHVALSRQVLSDVWDGVRTVTGLREADGSGPASCDDAGKLGTHWERKHLKYIYIYFIYLMP